MGLISLEKKIGNKLVATKNFSEEDVVYLLVEMGKYLERSKKDLGDSNDLKLKANDFKIVCFFRDWVAHTEKDRGKIPDDILQNFEKILSGQVVGVEEELFELLKNEIEKFNDVIGGSEIKINWGSFHDSLKRVLSEQPAKVLCEERYIGYNKDSLDLEEVKK